MMAMASGEQAAVVVTAADPCLTDDRKVMSRHMVSLRMHTVSAGLSPWADHLDVTHHRLFL